MLLNKMKFFLHLIDEIMAKLYNMKYNMLLNIYNEHSNHDIPKILALYEIKALIYLCYYHLVYF